MQQGFTFLQMLENSYGPPVISMAQGILVLMTRRRRRLEILLKGYINSWGHSVNLLGSVL